jgi:hypothetical protein
MWVSALGVERAELKEAAYCQAERWHYDMLVSHRHISFTHYLVDA